MQTALPIRDEAALWRPLAAAALVVVAGLAAGALIPRGPLTTVERCQR